MKKLTLLALALVLSSAAKGVPLKGTLQPDGSFICTANTLGLANRDDIARGSIHHFTVAPDFSQVQVFLVQSDYSAADPFVLKRTRENGYTAWFGISAYPEDVDSPAAAIDTAIATPNSRSVTATYDNHGRAETITCSETVPQ